MSVNLYVGNLPYRVDEDSLRQLFTPYGNVETAKVIKDRQTGKSKGFGFVEMTTQAEADAAIRALNETAMDGRNVKVSIAKPREERPPRRGGWDDRRYSSSRSARRMTRLTIWRAAAQGMDCWSWRTSRPRDAGARAAPGGRRGAHAC